MSLFSVVFILILFACLSWFLFLKPCLYWKNKKAPYVRPIPFFGNLGSFILQRCHLIQSVQNIYAAHPDARYVGFHKLLQPALLIKDPELLKTITVKDWHSFSEHNIVVSEGVDPLWGYSIVAMKGNELWRQMRSVLSFAFTSSKLKKMFCLMKNCSREFTKHIALEKGDTTTIDIKEAFSKYTNDVIGTTAFGVSCNSFKQPDNNFYRMGKDATNFQGLRTLKFFLNGLSPYLMAVLNIGIYSKPVRTFFYNIVKETLEKRIKYKIRRHDMINLMMEAKQNGITDNQKGFPNFEETCDISCTKNKLVINDDVITAQALIFFIGGFETTATVMSFAAYEMACNLEVQKMLYQEIDAAYRECNGDITYASLTSLTYLDMVISETLRKWPPIIVSDRAVVKRYTIEPVQKSESPLILDTNICCAIPIFSLHRDAKYYPDPEKFDPERFSEKNKVNIKPYTYLPFGCGPRGCIGSRFALLEIKLIIAEIIYKYEIIPTPETEIPVKLSPRSFLLRPENGIILALKRRNN